ncbi:MAG: hypothetical protein AUK47_16060 [Deltaproteobacteria bacterium CG2_30_63_29]|nr:MAG: hypothetical protein AUK47_16060 [Deltaproteobacteria bacterium CG2_30_63_29]PJB33463.1 MAG: hypothetical protein CO108_30825 [Deltaproteobacteria bacterium CG_4_9_14_3_um_filter_63_12]
MKLHSSLESLALVLVLAAGPSACSEEPAAPLEEGTELGVDDLGIGELTPGDDKADGVWGAATTCKAIPDLPRLVNPKITISLNGLTVHLVDTATGYDRVFAAGPGSIDTKVGSKTFGESLSMFPLLAYGTQDFAIKPSTSTSCKIWWTDRSTGQKLPVFAGLPFLSWSGNYALHGPVDNYRAPNGGDLRRGFVSHGCIRMQAADILELYGRIRGVASVPVHVQREPERLADGRRVDLSEAWFGAECATDQDCNYTGGLCKLNQVGGRGYCTQRCTKTCPDRAGYPVSFCVPDSDDMTKGMCVLKETAVNSSCRPIDHFQPTAVNRFNGTAQATACMPASPGGIGDHCFVDDDCDSGNGCEGATATDPGLCTQPCTRYCPDTPGWPGTFCVNESSLGGPVCLRRCTLSSNASECPADSTCEERGRNGFPATIKTVCVPQ